MDILKLNLKYSQQAIMLLRAMKDFNEDNFIEWYSKQPIGGNLIMNYLTEREEKKNGNIK
jgi:hypothetical protein